MKQEARRGSWIGRPAHRAPRPRVDNAMVKALARAFRWRKMLDTGVHATLEDLARATGVNATYALCQASIREVIFAMAGR
jgi:hypothetical protein